jgi:hypothetical protein
MARRVAAVSSIFVAVVLTGLIQAQTTGAPSPYRVDYFANAAGITADPTLRLDNDGAASNANLCADIFVFNANEEISECCSCLETPDDLLTLDVNTNLLSNPANGVPAASGLIKIVAAAPTKGSCPIPSRITLVPNAEIQSWATHLQNNGTLTETASQAAFLSSAEESRLAKLCGAISAVDSGTGICNCTGAGD